MTLSPAQIAALQQGDAVRLPLPEVGQDCIVVRADIYEQVQRHAADEWSDEELQALALRTFADADHAEAIQP